MRINAVIHGATCYDDRLIQDQTLEHFSNVFDVKYGGAKNLHDIVGDSLKYFVVYSSISVAVGNIGQANYVAANAALEGLVHKRLQMGLPALAIEWGSINDVGYLADQNNDQVKANIESFTGGASLTSSEALEFLPFALKQGGVQIYANVNWAQVCKSINQTPLRLKDVANRSQNLPQNVSSLNFIALVQSKTKEEALNIISDLLAKEIADTMGLSVDEIRRDQDLQAMGLDSLMAMDLIVSLEKKISLRLSVMVFQDHPTITKLAQKIYAQINPKNENIELKHDQGLVSTSASISNHDVRSNVLATHMSSEDLNKLNIDLGGSK